MQLDFKVEDGVTFLNLKFDVADRSLLDKQCAKLGLTESSTADPFGFHCAEPIPYWQDRRGRASLASAVQSATVQTDGTRTRYTDAINDSLSAAYGDGTFIFNMGLLRLRCPADTPLRLQVADHILTPAELQSFVRNLTKAYQAIASITFECSVTIKVVSGAPLG